MVEIRDIKPGTHLYRVATHRGKIKMVHRVVKSVHDDVVVMVEDDGRAIRRRPRSAKSWWTHERDAWMRAIEKEEFHLSQLKYLIDACDNDEMRRSFEEEKREHAIMTSEMKNRMEAAQRRAT